MKNRIDGDDSFWDVAHLMPQGARRPNRTSAPTAKKAAPTPPVPPVPPVPSVPPVPPVPSVPPVPKKPTAPAAPTASTTPEKASGTAIPRSIEKPCRVYEYPDRAIFKVEIYPWPNHYSFFSGFQKNAISLLELPAEKAPVVPFFSFMPQYHQLTAPQLRFYLYWRKCFLEGLYLHTDFSYLLLFIYEIINLPSRIAPSIGVKHLCRLWSAYRKTYPKLDKYLSEWVCDYCLINGISKSEIPSSLCLQGRKNGSLPEFYMDGSEEESLLYVSSYDYRKSRFYADPHKETFDTHIKGALLYLEQTMKRRGDARFVKEQRSPQRITRTSFDGAVCVYSEKKRMEIEYLPGSDHGGRGIATDAVKFCENRVRAALGIRSRFSTPALQGDVRLILEQYFKEHLPVPQKNPLPKVPEYESKYEAESHGFSFEEAKRIEEQSLGVAERLGGIFEEQQETPLPCFVPAPSPVPPQQSHGESKECVKSVKGQDTPDGQIKTGLRILFEKGHEHFLAFAKEERILPSTLCQRINEQALELYADIVIEEENGRFAVISDYHEEVTRWINS